MVEKGMLKRAKKLGLGMLVGASMVLGACSSTDINNTLDAVQKGTEIVNDIKGSSQKASKEGLHVVSNVEAVDGDTIKYKYEGKKYTARFLLVDTPETKHPKLGVQKFGKEASNYTKGEILKAKKVEIEFEPSEGETDKYGRQLVYVYVDGKSLQEKLLKGGYARVAYIYKSSYIHLDEYKKAEAEGKSKKLRIWSIPGYATEKGFGQGVSVSEAKAEENAKAEKNGSCEVKATASHKYHVEGGQYYDTLKDYTCYASEEDAKADGNTKSAR